VGPSRIFCADIFAEGLCLLLLFPQPDEDFLGGGSRAVDGWLGAGQHHNTSSVQSSMTVHAPAGAVSLTQMVRTEGSTVGTYQLSHIQRQSLVDVPEGQRCTIETHVSTMRKHVCIAA
jgi:hypothetical protein